MKINKYGKLLGIFTFSLALMLGADSIALGQKGGKGGGKGHDGGKHENRGNGGEKHGNRGDDGGSKADKGGGWKQKMGGWEQPPQIQVQPKHRQIWREPAPQASYEIRENGKGQKGKDKWKGDKGNARRDVIIPQVPWGGGWIPPGQIRKQEVHARNAERKALKEQFKEERKAYKRYEKQNRYDDRDSYRQSWVDQGRRIFRNIYPDRSRTVYEGDQYTYAPRLQQRVQQYQPNYEAYRYQGPVAPAYNPGYFGYDPYAYSPPVYNSGYYGYDPNSYGYAANPYAYDQYGSGGTSLKQMLIRTLISTVLSGVLNRGGGSSYGQNYDPYYASGPVNYGYTQPSYYGYGQPQYYGSGYAPQYSGYNTGYLPAAYSAYGQPAYGYDPYLSGGGLLNSGGGLLSSIPLASILGQGGRGGYVTQILTQVLAQGYLQGLLAGENARESGYGEDGYYDPYVSQEGVYDPYSYTIGENRRVMSEGYDLGFEDALEGRNQYNPQAVGNVDLVSLLLGNVFKLM